MMATAPFNTNLTVQPMQTQSPMTGLSDMLNLARGIQSYQQAAEYNPLQIQQAKLSVQQAEAMNPLLLQQKQQELAQAAAMNPLAVQKATTEAEQARFSLDMAQNAKLYDLIGGYANDPAINSGDSKKVSAKLLEMKNEAAGLFADVPQAERKVSNVFERLIQKSIKDPQGIPQAFKNAIQFGIGPAGQQTLQTGGTIELNGVKYHINPSTRQLERLGDAGAPGGQAGQTPALTQDARSPGKSLVMEDMPVTAGNIAQLTAQQTDRYNSGVKLIDQSVQAGQNAQESKQSIRKINEYINKAAGSAPGQALRKAGKWLFGDSETEMLMKNLADQQLRMANAMGVPTNMARETSDLASGSADITPKALKSVIDRSDAMNTAVDEFRSGLKKYVDNRGALNGTIHANKFQQAWADNYDVRIFLAKNIQDSNMSEDEKKRARIQLLSGMSQKEMKELQEKASNIENLMKGGIK